MASETWFDSEVRPDELELSRPRFVRAPWGSFALYGSAEDFVCAEAFCPHMEGPLFEGTCTDGTITCPWHRWRYRLDTGERVDERSTPMPESRPLVRCKTRIGDAGTILVCAPTEQAT